ncbi:hypothetical protein LNJ40_11995 [Tenacibaculum dicentrarchi]|nr:hypothetical protein [Tenacibaculum dicentrarchi]
MEEKIKNVTEGEAKDLILKSAIKLGDKPLSAVKVHKDILPDISLDEIEFLFKKIRDINDQVADVRISEFNCLIIANGITEKFIKQGGFTKQEKNILELQKKEIEKERIDFEKSNIDLRLKRWQVKTFWWIFGFSFIGFGFSVYNFISNLSSVKKSEQLEEKIVKMESELKKLQTSISNQKTIYSLNNPKDLKSIENTEKSKDK